MADLNPDPIARYREVWNRPGVQAGNPALLWGNDENRAGQDVYDNFVQLMGREPTQNELYKLLPTFQQSHEQGLAALANFQDLENQKPENLMKQAGKYSDQVNGVFQNILGRQASQDELNHFGTLLASGNVDAYGLQDFLRGTPEYQTAADQKFRSGLNTELQGYDQQAFDRGKNDIFGDYAARGLGGSSSLDYALTDLMGQLAKNRGQYLAGLSAQQYGGNKQLALDNYQNSLHNFQDQRNYNRGIAQQGLQGSMQRANDIGDYSRQFNDYLQGLQGRNTLHTGDWINLGLAGANSAARFYGASKMGGGGGGGGGGNYSYLNGYAPYQSGNSLGLY